MLGITEYKQCTDIVVTAILHIFHRLGPKNLNVSDVVKEEPTIVDRSEGHVISVPEKVILSIFDDA